MPVRVFQRLCSVPCGCCSGIVSVEAVSVRSAALFSLWWVVVPSERGKRLRSRFCAIWEPVAVWVRSLFLCFFLCYPEKAALQALCCPLSALVGSCATKEGKEPPEAFICPLWLSLLCVGCCLWLWLLCLLFKPPSPYRLFFPFDKKGA